MLSLWKRRDLREDRRCGCAHLADQPPRRTETGTTVQNQTAGTDAARLEPKIVRC
jgi:hypothetical protein